MATLQRKTRKLLIGSKRGKWRANQGVESGDREFAMARPKVLARDGGTCVYCGIAMDKMHVHHENDNHDDNRMENLVTVDDLCHAVNHIGLLGKAGVIVYMPGVSQVDISHLCRTIVVAISCGGEIGKKAQKLAELLLSRFSEPVAKMFGSCNPADFGNALLALSDSDYTSREVPLRDVRVMFKPEPLGEYATRARDAIYKNLPPDIWGRIYEDFEGGGST